MLKLNSSKRILSLILSFTVLTSSLLSLPTLKASAVTDEQIENLRDFCYNKSWYAENTWFSIVHYMENGRGHTIAKHVFDYSNQSALNKRLADIKKKQVCKLIDEDIFSAENELANLNGQLESVSEALNQTKEELLKAALNVEFYPIREPIRDDILKAYIESWVNCKYNDSDSSDVSSAKTRSQNTEVTFPLRFLDKNLGQDKMSEFVRKRYINELGCTILAEEEIKRLADINNCTEFMQLFENAVSIEIMEEEGTACYPIVVEKRSISSIQNNSKLLLFLKHRVKVFKVIDTKLNQNKDVSEYLNELNGSNGLKKHRDELNCKTSDLLQQKEKLTTMYERFSSGAKYDEEMTAYVNNAEKKGRFNKTAVTMFKDKNDAEAVVKEFLKRNMSSDTISTYRKNHQNSKDKINIGIYETTNTGIIEWLKSNSNASFSGIIEYKENINKAGCRLSRFIQNGYYHNEFHYDKSNKYVVVLEKNKRNHFGFNVITCYPIFDDSKDENLEYSEEV